jgi:hypothetical protein
MAPSGMTLPMWYCPVRSWNSQTNNAWCIQNLGHPESTLADLYCAVCYPNGSVNPNPAASFAVTYHSVWIQRLSTANNPSSVFPSAHNTVFTSSPNINANTAAGLPWPNDWLKKPSDPNASRIPIMTDQVVGDQTGSFMYPGQGHPAGGSSNGQCVNENLLYGDGHVETHNANTMLWRWKTSSAPYTSWY